MIAYASRTGTRRNLAALRRANWRLLVSATGVLRHEGFQYALDNGAWTAFAQGRPWDERLFVRALSLMGRDADWTVLPDVVQDGPRSLDLALQWMRRVLDETPRALIAVQNGVTPDDVRPFLGARVGLFVGGDTEWKLRTMPEWGALGHQLGCWTHVGRVNSARRIALCHASDVTSFDGTSVTRFAKSLPRLDNAVRQTSWRF